MREKIASTLELYGRVKAKITFITKNSGAKDIPRCICMISSLNLIIHDFVDDVEIQSHCGPLPVSSVPHCLIAYDINYVS